MNLFNDPKDRVPSILAVVGILLLVGSLLAVLIIRPPKKTAVNNRKLMQLRKLVITNTELKKQNDEYEQYIAAHSWTEKPEIIASTALSELSKLCDQFKLKLVAFRPQRISSSARFSQYPYVVTVDGSFPNMLNMLVTLERNKRLALNQVLVSSSDANSDAITANVGLVAFRSKELEESETNSKPANTSSTSIPSKDMRTSTKPEAEVVAPKPAANTKETAKP